MNTQSFWLVGHRITPVSFSSEQDVLLIETPPHTDGPPPHYHINLDEMFVVLEGEMEYICGDEKGIKKQGELMIAPRNTVHTFSNRSASPLKVLKMHSPQGFAAYMQSVGIPETEELAQQTSVTEAAIMKLVQTAADNDMHIVAVDEKVAG